MLGILRRSKACKGHESSSVCGKSGLSGRWRDSLRKPLGGVSGALALEDDDSLGWLANDLS